MTRDRTRATNATPASASRGFEHCAVRDSANPRASPSGHVDKGETVSDAAVREAAEETGVRLAPGEVRCVTVVHHRGPGGQARIGWFFAAGPGWDGEPVNREPAKHSELAWIDPADPPEDLVAYTWAGLRAWQAGAPMPFFSRSRAARSA
jgi:ADP-ribose pyrophosphatase YjhB (NUDIX family)